MRAIWSGTLSFGLLNIPVHLFSASKDRALKFHLFDKNDHCPISYKKVCRSDDHPVDQKDIVKGFEYEKGQFVILSPEDFKSANVKKTGSIEILKFSDLSTLDERFYEKPYFVIPDEKSAKAYVLLRDAIEKTGKSGIARFVLREKEHIAAIKVNSHLITLVQMRFQDELIDPSEFRLPRADYSKRELDMAISLIENLTEPFRMADYQDTYTDELMHIIQIKAKGQKVTPVGREPEATPLDMNSIMSLLEKSLHKDKSEPPPRKKASGKRSRRTLATATR